MAPHLELMPCEFMIGGLLKLCNKSLGYIAVQIILQQQLIGILWIGSRKINGTYKIDLKQAYIMHFKQQLNTGFQNQLNTIQNFYSEQASAQSMPGINQHACMFACGLYDSISLYWIRKILFVTHPTTKKIHPLSLVLLTTFKNTFIQVFVFLIGLPYIFKYFNQEFIGTLLSSLFLTLTYGYLFFYNTQVMTSTKKVALWASKFPNTNFCQFDNRQKAELFYSLSNQIKSFIFLLLYYMPILITCLLIISYFPFVGTILLLISQSFFNSAFYFLKKWPYDRYNVAFIQKNISYMLGYGFFVSFVCNVCLSGDFSRGAYFIISQWMIINCLLYSPPEARFSNFKQLWKSISSSEARSKIPNAYNIHRTKIRKDKAYRQKILNDIIILKPALKITQFLNSILAKNLGQSLNLNLDTNTITTQINSSQQKQRLSDETVASTDKSKISSNTSNNRLEIVSEVYQTQDFQNSINQEKNKENSLNRLR